MEISHKQVSRRVYCRDVQPSLIAAFFQLTYLLEAGVGLGASLKEVSALEHRWALQRVWIDIEKSVIDGQSFSVSMERWPSVFDATLIALLRSGETRGQLSSACFDCLEFLEWQQNIKARMTTVLLYPIFALIIVGGVLGFLMVYLVPSLEELLRSSGHQFPWHARILLTLSEWIQQYFILLVIGTGVCGAVLGVARITSIRASQLHDALLLRIPLYGTLILNLTLSRYFETCAKLYASGIGLTDAMQKSECFVKNLTLRAQLYQARLNIVAGKSLSVALGAVSTLSPIHIQVLSAAEISGQLGKALERTGSQQRRVADNRIEHIEKMIGPVVLLVAGFSLLWVVLSLLSPIYESAVDSVILL